MKGSIEEKTETITYKRPVLRVNSAEYSRLFNAVKAMANALGRTLASDDKITKIAIRTAKGEVFEADVIIDERA